jgi:hypothetical protein
VIPSGRNEVTREAFKAAMRFGVQPSEFWSMHPWEFWALVEAHTDTQLYGSSKTMTEAEVRQIYEETYG